MSTQAEPWDQVWQEYEVLAQLNSDYPTVETFHPVFRGLVSDFDAGLTPSESYYVGVLREWLQTMLERDLLPI